MTETKSISDWPHLWNNPWKGNEQISLFETKTLPSYADIRPMKKKNNPIFDKIFYISLPCSKTPKDESLKTKVSSLSPAQPNLVPPAPLCLREEEDRQWIVRSIEFSISIDVFFFPFLGPNTIIAWKVENFGEKRREIYINSRSFSGMRDNLVVRDDGSLPKRIMLGKEIVALLASHCCSPDGFVIDRY